VSPPEAEDSAHSVLPHIRKPLTHSDKNSVIKQRNVQDYSRGYSMTSWENSRD